MVANEIISAVSVRLAETFDGYKIYQNDVQQGLKEPCFFIAVLNPMHTPFLARRRKITVPLDIHFFPERKGDNQTMCDVADQLIDALEYVATPDEADLLRANNMSYEIQDGVLHFFVTYAVVLNDYQPEDAMETLDLEEGTIHGD